MNIEELLIKAKELMSLRDKCHKEWEDYMWRHLISREDVHYCSDTCPIAKICHDAGIGTCELLIDVLEVFKNQKNDGIRTT